MEIVDICQHGVSHERIVATCLQMWCWPASCSVIHPSLECLLHAVRDKVVAGSSQLGSQVLKDVKGKGMPMFILSFLSVISHAYLSFVSSISQPPPLFLIMAASVMQVGCSSIVHVLSIIIFSFYFFFLERKFCLYVVNIIVHVHLNL